MMRRMIERVMSLGAGLLTPPLQRPQVSRSRLRNRQARQGDLRSSQVRGQETRAQQGRAYKRVVAPLVLLIALAGASTAQDAVPPTADEHRLVLVVRGTSGTDEYGRQFDEWAERWVQAARQGRAETVRVGPNEADTANEDALTDYQKLQRALGTFGAKHGGSDAAELWIVLIGHGTFDGRTARFNLEGPDVSDNELSQWLEPLRCRTAIVNCASSSGPFLKTLARNGRVVITSTKSGAEQNFSRFGDHLSKAIGDASFDLDKDGQTSLFEAFLSASRQTEQFYETEGRLATEHALLDDTGDGQGTRADFFRGIRLVKQTNDGTEADGRIAHQFHLVRSDVEQSLPPGVRAKRDEIEQQVLALRDRRKQFANDEAYYAELEPLLIRLAEAYELANVQEEKPASN
jgi:hypothetical protein